ncbi:carboxypeptidase regulatory-like domain-containing protein [Streptomyces coffeae]|uniref:Carboxypeptidase regulatory-like domain-containing protein n=1 Tax=Streptomyces coffeae TaxID=621382 RepID=A0ABS1NEH6_9ACTN|nr:carboxypeptidase regulatory-like domain-containing protein [Streptomyces coffeae]MBL1098379.1 carboxypeptidase regulatory-like domain-containing protein [Streptomyces coffeae]
MAHAFRTPAIPRRRSSLAPTARTLAENLWLPALFLAGLLFSYLVAFHQPAPHHIKVAVAASPQSTAQLQDDLDRATPGAFDLVPVGTLRDAKSAVAHQDAVAALEPQGNSFQLYGAKADGAALESVVLNAFTGAAQHAGKALHFHELVPTLPGDGLGSTGTYAALACTLPCYFVVIGMQRAVGFNRRRQCLTFLGCGVLIAGLSYVFSVYGLHALPEHPLLLLYLFLLTQAISLTAYGLVPFFGRFFPGVAATLFMLLGMPSSGGMVPVALVPEFFRFLHPILPLGNAVDAVRSVAYLDHTKLARPTLALAGWAVGGLVLILLGCVKQRRKLRAQEAPDEASTLQPAPVDDPSMELPAPTSLTPHHHHFGEQQPLLVGRVVDDSDFPVAGAVLTVTTGHGRELLRARTDANGEYAATGLPDGYVLALVSRPEHMPSARRVLIDASRTTTQDFQLAAPLRKPGLPVNGGAVGITPTQERPERH